jgi:hypothetical protein
VLQAIFAEVFEDFGDLWDQIYNFSNILNLRFCKDEFWPNLPVSVENSLRNRSAYGRSTPGCKSYLCSHVSRRAGIDSSNTSRGKTDHDRGDGVVDDSF